MEPHRRRTPLNLRRSIASDRFLSPFSPPNSGDSAGLELDEDDLFFSTGSESPEPDPQSPPPPNPFSTKIRTPIDGFRRLHENRPGLLAALPEESTQIHLLHRKPSISLSSSLSTTPSPSPSSARLIPATPTHKSVNIYHQSAPVNVPVRLRRAGGDAGKGEREDEEEMLPPHEIVARASERESPLTTFSVLEGEGRTLKGRDQRRLRNAVWRRTGFVD